MLANFFSPKAKFPDRSLDEIKNICKIVFIDDHKFSVTDILRKAGWINTKRLRDVSSLDESDIKEAHILFVDIQGVGKLLKFKDEGLGLITAIRNKYPHKNIVVYSAESAGDRFHEGLSKADSRLSKNADPYEFQVLVEKYAKESFSLDESLRRLQDVLQIELGYPVDKDSIIKNLNKLHKNNSCNVGDVSRIFNLQNAGAVATIIQLLLTGK
jgi:DNA-binding NarL/FixJ family response regulator